jgi:DNA ligase (NAD+)
MLSLDQEREVINPPTNCPSCDSILEWSNDQLYCRNPDCGASKSKQVEHFASTLKIKGLGPSTISKLHLSSILDIYLLDKDELIDALGSERISVKLYDEIQLSKTKPLNYVLPAFGIPLIGKTATDKLSKVCKDLQSIAYDTCKEAGLGEKATENLMNWLNTNEEYELLPLNLSFVTESVAASSSDRGVVCISGKLNSYSTKQEAQVELEKLGFTVKSSITKDVTILVNESGRETTKTQKAKQSGIIIVTDLKQFIGDIN